jgi:tetratricopeptide (TPR) repeat protein
MTRARNHRSLRSTCIHVVALCVLGAPAAHADRAAAKPHVDAGAAAYAAGKYDEASSELERAYVLDPDPALLYARAQALRLGGRCGDAIALYREYLATNPNEQQAETTRTHLVACEQVVAEQPPEPSPATEPPPSAAPQTLPAPATQDSPTRDSPRWYSDRIGGALVIGGAAAIGVGVGFLVVSSRSRDDARNAELRVDAVRALDDATLERRIGIAAIGVGVALVSGGVVRYLSLRNQDADIAISMTPSEVVVFGRF